MKCPYCGEEMHLGNILVDKRFPVKWYSSDEKIGWIEKWFGNKGEIKINDIQKKGSTFEIEAHVCFKCDKTIIQSAPKQVLTES